MRHALVQPSCWLRTREQSSAFGRDEVQGFAKNESIAWPWESDKQAAFNEFERMWGLMGITSTREGGSCNITCYKDQVFPKKVVPALSTADGGNS